MNITDSRVQSVKNKYVYMKNNTEFQFKKVQNCGTNNEYMHISCVTKNLLLV